MFHSSKFYFTRDKPDRMAERTCFPVQTRVYKQHAYRLKDRFRDFLQLLRHPRRSRAHITDRCVLHEELQDALRATRPPETDPDELAAALLDEQLRKITGARPSYHRKDSRKAPLITRRRISHAHSVPCKRRSKSRGMRTIYSIRYVYHSVAWKLRRVARYVRRGLWRRRCKKYLHQTFKNT